LFKRRHVVKNKWFSMIVVFVLTLSMLSTWPAKTVKAQGPVDVSENFSSFTGSGYAPTPAAGQLDSNSWIATGFDGGTLTWGGSQGSDTDFGRGTSSGNVTTGGIYAFNVGSGNVILGVQPGGNDFTPGSLRLRIQNTTGFTLRAVDISYKIWTLNNAPRSNSLNFSYSTDDTTYTPLPSLNYATPEVADASPAWVSTTRSATITGLTLQDGDYLYLSWDGDDVSGSGARDEYGIDDVQVSLNAINVDGDLSDWNAATEKLGAINGRSIYMTWDDDNIYFAAANAGGAGSDHYIVAIDTDPDEQGIANVGATAAYQGADWNTGADIGNHPNYLIDSFFDVFTEMTQQHDGSGGWTTWTPTVSKVVRCADNTCAEWVFSKSEIGVADGDPIGVFIWFTNGSGNVYNAWPPENRQNNGTFYAYAYTTGTENGHTPRMDVQRRGSEQFWITNGGNFSYLNNWVKLLEVNTYGDDGCYVTVSVKANGQFTTSTDDFRRTVTINRQEGCLVDPTVKFQIFYEDGTTNDAPSELGVGDVESTLNIYRWGSWINLGADWRDSSLNFIEKQNLSFDQGETYYILGSDAPTVITLRNLTAENSHRLSGVLLSALSAAALLGGGFWLVRRRKA